MLYGEVNLLSSLIRESHFSLKNDYVDNIAKCIGANNFVLSIIFHSISRLSVSILPVTVLKSRRNSFRNILAFKCSVFRDQHICKIPLTSIRALSLFISRFKIPLKSFFRHLSRSQPFNLKYEAWNTFKITSVV